MTGEITGSHGMSAGMSFSRSTYVPGVFAPMTGIQVGVNLEPGILTGPEPTLAMPGTWKRVGFSALYTSHWIKDDEKNFSKDAYGFNYSQHATSTSMMDINRDKDVAISPNIPSAPMPVVTYDTYQVMGQGIGGTFRPFRGDIGLYHDEQMSGQTLGVTGGYEFGVVPAELKAGFDYSLRYSYSQSGNWTGGASNISTLDSYGFDTDDPLYEPFYFKMTGEMTANDTTFMDEIGGEDAVRLRLSTLPETVQSSGVEQYDMMAPQVHNAISYSAPYGIDDPTLTSREIRTSNIQYRTKEMVTDYDQWSLLTDSVWAWDDNPVDNPGDGIVYTYPSELADHHVAEIEVQGPNGMRYIYNIPAMNYVHEEVSFAVASPGETDYPQTINYDIGASGDNTLENDEGVDNYYNQTSIDPYVHGYMLGAVVSPDYVDLTGDGFTEDDFGYYTKFNYSDITSSSHYKWRIPFDSASYSKGYYSNELDDRASYTYGEKDIYLLNSVETKTHIAIFILGERQDAKGVSLEDQIGSSSLGHSTYFLKQIKLFAKEDLDTPIQTVHFAYSYDLCQGVDNNTGTDTDMDGDGSNDTNNGGKLTLTKVWFTYLDNDKGQLSPYQFSYYENVTDANNPDYNQLQMDRWGYYQPDSVGTSDNYWINSETPYVNQFADRDDDDDVDSGDDLMRNDYASAWCLEQITLPSGGQINIHYEQDDYGFVQDQQAMQMMRIIGFSPTSTDAFGDISNTMSNGNLRVYFELDEEIAYSATDKDEQIARYINGLTEVYFKTYQRLKKEPEGFTTDWQHDYVEGYAQIETGSDSYGVCVDGSNDHKYGYITVQVMDYGPGDVFEAHPMKFAGWQYIQNQRPDLFSTPNAPGSGWTPAIGVFWEILGTVTEISSLLFGYYNMAAIKNWCKKINVEDKPSFVRLTTPDYTKYGGGHRVQKLTMTDNWSAVEGYDATYGQQFEYQNVDGTSSGVASYEPMVGGEENALRKPDWYNGTQETVSFKSQQSFVEEPYGEAYYPSPMVGYGRVVVKNIVNKSTTSKTSPGYQVHEFYTAKDFPVIVEKTELLYRGQNNPFTIPLIGYIGRNSHGYSQGYKIELNNMHGVLKAVSVYGYGTDYLNEPLSKTEYFYSTNPNNSKQLYNRVQVLNGEGAYEESYLGQTYDFFIDLDEHYGISTTFGMSTNVQGSGVFWVPSLFPISEYDQNLYRSVVTNKVVYKSGILVEVAQTTDGSTRVTKNHMFDATTGAPLLTSVTNEWEEPVYTYNIPGHWAYQGLDNASQNWSMYVAVKEATGSPTNNYAIEIDGAESPHADLWIHVGCEIVNASGDHYWVTDIASDGTFDLEDATGSDPGLVGTTTFWIHRSSHRNQQNVNAGTIVSLTNPVSDRYYQVFEEFNENGDSYNYTDTCQGSSLSVTVTTPSSDRWRFRDATPATPCDSYLIFQDGSAPSINGATILTNTFDRISGIVQILDSGGNLEWATWQNDNECYGECIDVLHADAIVFEDNWTYNYADVGDPTIDNDSLQGPISSTSGNDFRFGKKGIWRVQSQYVHQIDREQTDDLYGETRIDVDGEYQDFTLFDWNNISTNYNNNWLRTDSATMYSPYGFALENMSAINVHSSELYGYDNSVVTVTAANSEYMEIAFDGFEDYDGTYVLGNGHGHLDLLDDAGAPELSTAFSHTGDYSVLLRTDDTLEYTFTVDAAAPNYFTGQSEETYVISAWFNRTAGSGDPLMLVYDVTDAQYITPSVENLTEVDGWQKVDLYMDSLVASHVIRIEWSFGNSGAGYVDDIRIHPFDGAQATYVYDPQTLWLVAELDNRNYATFYSYDEEGTLVQVRKETIDGIVTLSTSRQNTFQDPNQ